IGDRERAVLERVVMAILRQGRERERSAHRGLELPAGDASREFEVADERPSVGPDRSGDDRLPEVRVVVVEAPERSATAALPRARERTEHVVPAALTTVDDTHTAPTELSRPPRPAPLTHPGEA